MPRSPDSRAPAHEAPAGETEQITLRLPPLLKEVVKLYASSRVLSMNHAFRVLIESHPDISALLARLYGEV